MVYPIERIAKDVPSTLPPGTPIGDPLQHLEACHERIEQHLQILERAVGALRSTQEDECQQAREALSKALSFLKTMGELHTQDEEDSLFPRLRAYLGDDPYALGELMVMLDTQHREKEGVYAELVGCVSAFPAAPSAPTAEQAGRCEGLVAQLTGIYRPHILIENERLLPLSGECLPKAALDEIREEMRQRHKL